MGKLRQIWNDLSARRNNNLFKQQYNKLYNEYSEIRGDEPAAQQLRKYRSLQKEFNNLYGRGQVKKSVDNIKLNDTNIISRGVLAASSVILLGVVLPVAAPLAITAAALAPFAWLAAIHLSYRREAKLTGLTAKDVKYVLNTRDIKKRVDKAVERLPVQVEKEKTLGASKTPAASRSKAPAPSRKPTR